MVPATKIQNTLRAFGRFVLNLIPPQTIMPILAGTLKGKRWIIGSGTHGYWCGVYEYQTRILFEKMVLPGKAVFDIGAHVGFYTLLAASLVGSRGQVIAFEPNPRNLFYLREHLRLNHIKNVTVVEAAISDQLGFASFDEGPNRTHGQIAPGGSLRVKTFSLDELTKTNQIPIPDYIKVDVEGAEQLVLLGARSLLADAHPTLFLTCHTCATSKGCRGFLEPLGYKLTPIGQDSLDATNEILAEYKGHKKCVT